MSMYCSECGAEINEKAEMCPECGVRVSSKGGNQTTDLPTESGLEENVAGALAYILGLVSGLFFYVTEDDNDFVRFHALQSIIFSVGAFILYWVLNTLMFSLFFGPRMFITGGGVLFSLFSLVTSLISLALLGVWVFLMYKAYNGERYKLPVVGGLAEQNS
jgi:uncharacterized membrane protein